VELGWASQGVSEAVVKLVAVWLGNAAIAHNLQATPSESPWDLPPLGGATGTLPRSCSASGHSLHKVWVRHFQTSKQLRGAAEARRAHNPEVTRSKRVAASNDFLFLIFPDLESLFDHLFLPPPTGPCISVFFKCPRWNSLSHQRDHPVPFRLVQGFAPPPISQTS
jgi:hypothetical protein